jgi:hypothetical protein
MLSPCASQTLSGTCPQIARTLLCEEILTSPLNYDAIPPSANQQGSTSHVSTNDGRVLSGVWLANNLWFSFNTGRTPQGDNTVRSCFGIIEVNTSNNSVTQQTFYDANGLYYFYPVLTVDPQNDMTVLVGYSPDRNFPSLAAYGQGFSRVCVSIRRVRSISLENRPLRFRKRLPVPWGSSSCGDLIHRPEYTSFRNLRMI